MDNVDEDALQRMERHKKDTLLHRRVFFLEDEYLYVYDMTTDETREPILIRDVFPELFQPNVGFELVDAAFTADHLSDPVTREPLDRKLFVFSRNKYLRVDLSDLDNPKIDLYPRPIAEGWPGVTFDRIDAVVNVAEDAVYFFQGNQYIRFNMLKNRADEGYPDFISRRWAGVTFDRIDAAVPWGKGKVYFFRDDQQIRYDMVLHRADPEFPKYAPSNYVEDWKFTD